MRKKIQLTLTNRVYSDHQGRVILCKTGLGRFLGIPVKELPGELDLVITDRQIEGAFCVEIRKFKGFFPNILLKVRHESGRKVAIYPDLKRVLEEFPDGRVYWWLLEDSE